MSKRVIETCDHCHEETSSLTDYGRWELCGPCGIYADQFLVIMLRIHHFKQWKKYHRLLDRVLFKDSWVPSTNSDDSPPPEGGA